MTSRGTALPQLGRFHEGVALLRESARLAGDSWSGVRARNNLLLYSSTDGYMPVQEHGRESFEMAKRVGHAALSMRLMTWVAQFDESTGAFDDAVAVIDSVDSADGAYWEASTKSIRERVLWRASGDPVHLERARRLTESILESPEPQYREWSKDFLSQVAWFEGDLETAMAYVRDMGAGAESSTSPAIFQFRHVGLAVAVRQGDLDGIGYIEALGVDPGKRRESLHALASLARDIISGTEVPDERVDGVLADLETADGPLDAAEWRAEFALALGQGQLATRLAAEARDQFEAVGDRGQLGRYGDLFASLEASEVAG
jgi:hypothetical protein